MFNYLDPIYREEAANILAASDGRSFFGTNEKRAKLRYKHLASMFHPDAILDIDSKLDAERVFKALCVLWEAYKAPNAPKSGTRAGVLIIDGVTYIIRSEAEYLSNSVFKAFSVVTGENDEHTLFVSRNPDAQRGIVNRINRIIDNGVCADLFPAPVSDEFALMQPDGAHTAFLAELSKDMLDNIRSLGYAYIVGRLDAKDIAWIWRRIISAAAVCEDLNIGFGFSPDLSYIEPETHGYYHMGFDCDRRRSQSNLASAATFMVALCDAMPAPMRRYYDAIPNTVGTARVHPEEFLVDFDYIISKLWGERKFHPFKYPA